MHYNTEDLYHYSHEESNENELEYFLNQIEENE